VAWFSTRVEAMRFAQGNPATVRSSEHVLRGFCAACGSTLTYQDDRTPDEIDIATASLDDPETVPPRDHTFAEQRLSWMRVDDGLPVYPRTRKEGA
jgi:hypothetical protein